MSGIHGSARRCGVVGVLALVLALVGCGGVVTNDSLEEQVKSRFAADTVNCPVDLRREVGQSTVCTATRDDETFDVRVTVTAVRGDRADDVDLSVERVGGPAAAAGTAMSTADSGEEQVRSRRGTDTAACPADLAGEVGRTMVCTATRGDETFDVRVTVTAVRADTLDLLIERLGGTATSAPSADGDLVSADPSTSVAGTKVAQSVSTRLSAQGKRVEQVTCPDLPAQVGASQRCTLVSDGATYGVTVAVTSVQGTDVRFDITVDQAPR